MKMPMKLGDGLVIEARNAAKYEKDPDMKREWELMIARLEGYFEGQYYSKWHGAITKEQYDSIKAAFAASLS